VAVLVDGVILAFGYLVVIIPIAVALGNGTSQSSTTTSTTAAERFVAVLFVWFVVSIPAAIYYAVMNGSPRGQTVGKMALGIAVRDARTGGSIGRWRGLGRYLITVLFAALFTIPYIIDSLSPLWDDRRQSWHDKVAGSVVVDLKP
jgi:uncharacterized RDD family membrane protein YckC